MSYTDWKDKTNVFKKIDVRGIQGNFFQGLKKQAMNTPVGEGLEIVQSFDPIPLYEVMEQLGFEYHTEQLGDSEFHAYFYRTEQKQDNGEIPMRPAALTNMPLIDEELGKVAVQFWDVTWNNEKRHLPYPFAPFADQRRRRGQNEAGDTRACQGVYPRLGFRRAR